MSSSDDALTRRLRRAFVDDAATPHPDDLATLRLAVNARLGVRGPAEPGPSIPSRRAATPHTARVRPLRSLRIAPALAAVAVVVAIGTTMIVPHPSHPGTTRLPATLSTIASTRDAARRLEAAIAADDTDAIRRATAALRHSLDHLGAHDREVVSPSVERLLAHAEAFLVRSGSPTDPAASTATSDATPQPSAGAAPPAPDGTSAGSAGSPAGTGEGGAAATAGPDPGASTTPPATDPAAPPAPDAAAAPPAPASSPDTTTTTVESSTPAPSGDPSPTPNSPAPVDPAPS